MASEKLKINYKSQK